ncbi:MAG: peptidoglycan editing factor PgeF [Bacteroidales bacterium]|jgi:hypothetical protein|nr:peptidoglycan editing factor PgeF [Bacteroidales bacterium]
MRYHLDNEWVCAFSSPVNVSLVTDNGARNRKEIAKQFGFDVAKLTSAEQVHGCNVAVVDEMLVGCGSQLLNSRIPSTDALVTNLRGVCLLILTADCVPIVLYDKRQKVIAAIHAGWRGTAMQIVVHTIEKMTSVFNSVPCDIEAVVGPHICGKCFEVGSEVVDAIGTEYVCGESLCGKPLLDLGLANKAQLTSAGVCQIESNDDCTFHNRQWPSWRRTNTNERLGTYIWLR